MTHKTGDYVVWCDKPDGVEVVKKVYGGLLETGKERRGITRFWWSAFRKATPIEIAKHRCKNEADSL